MLRVSVSRMSEREPEDRPEEEAFEGEEELLGGLPPSRDPYTPEPGPGPGEQRAFRLLRWAALLLVLVFGIVILVAIFR
jgi:hypothetical protein